MPIRVTCPSCQSASNAPDDFAGKRVRCRKCGVSVDVPAILTTEEPEPESGFQPVPDIGAEIARLRKQLQWTQLLGIVSVPLLATLLAVESRSRTSADAKAVSNDVTTNLHETVVFGKVVTKELMLTSGDGRTRARFRMVRFVSVNVDSEVSLLIGE